MSVLSNVCHLSQPGFFRRHIGLTALAFSAACVGVGELTLVTTLVFGVTFAGWLLSRQRNARAIGEAEGVRRALAAGTHRELEVLLRKELALAAAGEAVSASRQWYARTQLAGLMVAEWRLADAAEAYGEDAPGLPPHLQALAAFGRHELAILQSTPDEARLHEIRGDKERCVAAIDIVFRDDVTRAWEALEGLCLLRMGRAREGIPLMQSGLAALQYNPALVVYLFHLGQAYEATGEHALASAHYKNAVACFPGSRLANEAETRMRGLSAGVGQGFRRMLPAPPSEDFHDAKEAENTESA